MNKFPRGSEWRKWDLHIHTPGTAKNDNFGAGAWDEYITRLENQTDTIAYGITDYCSITNYLKVSKAQQEGRLADKFIFPNIEFRIKPVTGKSIPINLHVLLDPVLDINVVRREFLSKVVMEYEGGCYACTDEELAEFGKKIDPSVNDTSVAFRIGVEQFAVDYTCIKKALSSKVLSGHYLIGVANGSRDGASGLCLHDSAMMANRQEIYRMSHLIFSANPNDISYFLGKGVDSAESVILKCGSLKPCVRGSDAHSLNQIGKYDSDRATWIKANPTFEGLKQVVFEPEERVRIQEKSPLLDFDKAFLTDVSIKEQTPVFVDDNDVFFEATKIPLNPGLISIIGGRGTGKSVLLEYLSSGLGMGVSPEKYTCSSSTISVFGQASALDVPKEYEFKDLPQMKFIYISQGKIKDLIKDRIAFTRNIRGTIGVLTDYEIPHALAQLSEKTINEFYRIIKILSPTGESPSNYMTRLEEESHKYSAYIENVTSDSNREKLAKYTKFVERKNRLLEWEENVHRLVEDVKSFAAELNGRIMEMNGRLSGSSVGQIPQIDVSRTVEFLESKLSGAIEENKKTTEGQLKEIKECFASYAGDPSSLLANVASYKKRQTEIVREIEKIKMEESNYRVMTKNGFAVLGVGIRESIEAYTSLIGETWARFKEGNGDLPADRRELLHSILHEDNLNVRVEVAFDRQAMYDTIAEASYLDKRHFTQAFLERTLGIVTLDDFYEFIEQRGGVNLFSPTIEPKLRQRLIDVFFRKFTSFISHRIIVESNGKPLDKLSHGQKGTIYLRLQIAANLFTETIVYDQPEDDLDNRFITTELVNIFRKIKKFRQVIIVSHNANLVVNADSEQIIVADNDGGVLKYVSGALEDPDIRKAVCNILEGGREAFALRGKKYNI